MYPKIMIILCTLAIRASARLTLSLSLSLSLSLYVYVYVYVYVDVYLFMCMCVCVCIHTHTHTHTHTLAMRASARFCASIFSCCFRCLPVPTAGPPHTPARFRDWFIYKYTYRSASNSTRRPWGRWRGPGGPYTYMYTSTYRSIHTHTYIHVNIYI